MTTTEVKTAYGCVDVKASTAWYEASKGAIALRERLQNYDDNKSVRQTLRTALTALDNVMLELEKNLPNES